MRIGDEDRGRPRGRELPHRASGTRDREIRSRKRRAEPVGGRNEHVVVAPHLRTHGVVVALAGHVQDRRPVLAERSGGELVQRLRAGETAEHREHRTIEREPEELAPLPLGGAEMRGRYRPADHLVLAAVAPRDRIREEDPSRERRGEPIREPEVRVGLGQRGRYPAQPRGEHHRPRHVAAASEHHVRPSLREDPTARERRPHSLRQRTNEPDTKTPWEARDGERVELEAGLRNEPRLDAVGRPGERHSHSALAKRFRDCERGSNVTGCPSRRDHAPKLRRPVH